MNGRRERSAWLGLPLVVAVSLASFLCTFRQPAPAAPPSPGFSAERALADLEVLAARPRPYGSEAHAAAKRWLVAALEATGAELRVERHDALENVLVRVAGSEPTGAVLFVAHHDSRPETPGAADDGAAVVALLQTVELLVQGPPPRNELLFLFTDAEELGLHGARAFVADSPAFAGVSLVLNFDAIGNDGPLVMFQTGPGSGRLVERYGRSAPRPVTTSLAPFVYRRLPNDTDFTPFLEAGVPGLNFAIVGGATAYHEPFDTPQHLSSGTLQNLGETTLALARSFGAADLRSLVAEPDAERAFFDLLGLGTLVLPRWVAWTLVAWALSTAVLAAWSLARAHGGGVALAGGTLLFGALTVALVFVTTIVAGLLESVGGLLVAADAVVAPRGNATSATLRLVGLGLVVLALAVGARRRIDRGEDGAARRAALGAGGLVAWAVLVAAVAALGVEVAAQLPLALLLASSGVLLGRGFLPLLGALALALLAPHLALTYHLLAKDLDLAVSVLVIGLALGCGLVGPWLDGCSAGARPRALLGGVVLGGAGLVVAGARLAHLGG